MDENENNKYINREDLLNAIGNPFQNENQSLSSISFLTEDGFERFFPIDILRGVAVFLSIFGISQEIFKENEIYSIFIFNEWEGYKFIDYIPNLFIFVNGACIYFSISNNKKEKTKIQLILKALKKFFILLYLLII